MFASKMASASQNCCLSDPNYAVICSFLDQFGELLGLPDLTFKDVQNYLEDTRNLNDELLNILVRLMRRTGQKITFEKWQKGLIKFCHKYSQFDAWELERFGFKNSNLALKLRILKNLLEAQFDGYAKFKEKVNEKTAEDLRFQPLGRDRAGLAYWYLLDKELNLLVYQEEPDNSGNEGWKLVCQTREELACLISKLSTSSSFIKDEDSRSSTPSTTASNEKDVKPNLGEIKEEKLIFQGECEPEEKDQADNSRREDGVSEKIKTKEESAIDHEEVKCGDEVKVEGDVKVKVEPGIQASECKEEAEDKVDKSAVVKDEKAEVQEEEDDAERGDGEAKIDVKKETDSEGKKDENQDSGGTAPETNISTVSEEAEGKALVESGCDAAVSKETVDTPVEKESQDSSVAKNDGASGDGSMAKETRCSSVGEVGQSNDAVHDDTKTADETLAVNDDERKKDESNKVMEEKDLEVVGDGEKVAEEDSCKTDRNEADLEKTEPKDAIPSPKDVSPSPKDAVPSSKDASPSQKDVVPSPKDASPSQKDAVPSPKDASPSPEDASPSPKDASTCQEDASPSPKDASPSPKDVVPPPEDASPSPKDADPSPKDADPSPKDASPSPKDASPSQKDAVPSPKDVSPSPKDAVPSPKDASPSPKDAVPSPKDASPSLKDVIPSLENAVSSPKNVVPPPEDAAPSPKDASPSSEAAVPSPNDVTDETEEKTKTGDDGDVSKSADVENVDVEKTEAEAKSAEIEKDNADKKVPEEDPNGGSDLNDSVEQKTGVDAKEKSDGNVGNIEEKGTDRKDSLGDEKEVRASEEETENKVVEERTGEVKVDQAAEVDDGDGLKEKDQEAKAPEDRPDTKTRDTVGEKTDADQIVGEEGKKQGADVEKVDADDSGEADDKSVEGADRVEDEKEAVEIPEGDGSGSCDGGSGKNEEKEQTPECSGGEENGRRAKRGRCGGDMETTKVAEQSPKGSQEELDGKTRKGRNGKRKGKRKAADMRKEEEGCPDKKQDTSEEPLGPSEENKDGKLEEGENMKIGKQKAGKDGTGSDGEEKEGLVKEDVDQQSTGKEVKENGDCGDEKGEKLVGDEAHEKDHDPGNDSKDSSQVEKKDGDTGATENEGGQKRGRKRPRKQELIPIDTENLRRSSRQRKRPNILEDLENVPPVKVIKSRASQKSPQKSPQKANRKAAAPVPQESSDDDIPLSQVRKKGKGKGKRKGKKKKKDEDEDYEEVEELEEEDDEAMPNKKGKKNRKRKPDSDGDFVLSKKKGKQGKSSKSRGKKRKNHDSSSADAESSEDSEFAELLNLQHESESELSFGENSYDEFACEENDPNFTPKLGRNYQRAMSIAGKGAGDEPVVIGDDKPCTKCHKYDHPELILLCDKCDAGYHTTCTLPPLLLVPEGDWFCPPCEHAKLLDKLHIKLKDLDKQLKENERLVKRKERLAFVNISLDNILLKQEEEEPQHHKKKKKKKKKEKSHHHHRSKGLRPRFIEETEESEEDDEWLYTRSTRERKTVNYNFTDYDQMINSAIADDVEEEYDPAAVNVPVKQPKKEVKKKTPKSRGKDMENILAMQETEDCFQEFEQKKDEEKDTENDSEESEKDGGAKVLEEDEGRPPPVVKRAPKPRLTNLDDYEEGDDSEEYRATEDSVDEEEEEASLSDVVSEESDYKWQSVKSSRRQPRNKRGKRSNRWQDYVVDNFVVEESESDYSDDGVRRTRRAAAKKPVKYNESSDTDVSGPVITTSKKKRRVHESEEDYTASEKSSSSYSEPEPELVETEDDTPVKKRKRYEEDSDFEDHLRVKPMSRFQQRSAAMAAKFSRLKEKVKSKSRRRSYQRMVSDSEDESSKSESSESVAEESEKDSSPSKPKAKRRNIIKSSSEDSENEGESENEEQSAKKSVEPKSTKKSRTLKSESESEIEAPRAKKMNGHRGKSSGAVQGSFDDVMKSAGFKEAFLEGAGVSEDDEIANSDLSDVSDLVSYIDQH